MKNIDEEQYHFIQPKYKVLAIYLNDGYTIYADDGITQMEFSTGEKTSGIKTQREVWSICNDHDCIPEFV